jgi:hypothetical protein
MPRRAMSKNKRRSSAPHPHRPRRYLDSFLQTALVLFTYIIFRWLNRAATSLTPRSLCTESVITTALPARLASLPIWRC